MQQIKVINANLRAVEKGNFAASLRPKVNKFIFFIFVKYRPMWKLSANDFSTKYYTD